MSENMTPSDIARLTPMQVKERLTATQAEVLDLLRAGWKFLQPYGGKDWKALAPRDSSEPSRLLDSHRHAAIHDLCKVWSLVEQFQTPDGWSLRLVQVEGS